MSEYLVTILMHTMCRLLNLQCLSAFYNQFSQFGSPQLHLVTQGLQG